MKDKDKKIKRKVKRWKKENEQGKIVTSKLESLDVGCEILYRGRVERVATEDVLYGIT